MFGLPVAERAKEAVSSERTLYRSISRLGSEGIVSLITAERAKWRPLPPAMLRFIVDLKAEDPPMRPHEVVTIYYVRFGRRPGYRRVEPVLSEEPMPLLMVRRFPPYNEMEGTA